MKRIPKDLADDMVLNVLLNLSRVDDKNIALAKNSIDIMKDPIDNSLITAILLGKARPNLLDDNEIDMKASIMASIQTVISYRNEEEEEEESFTFNKDLAKEFSATDMEKCSSSTKLDFALGQFVNAFYEYERLEKKYTELMKFM